MNMRKQSNKQKNRIKKVFSVLLAMVLVLTSLPITADAAVNKSGRLNAWEKQVKIGNYYYISNSSGLYISSKKGNKGKLILPESKNGQKYDSNAYFAGNYIYYSYNKNSKSYVYRMKVNGKSKKMIAKISAKREDPLGSVELVYKNQILYSHSNIDGSDVYSVNVKTKKVKYLKGYSFSIVIKGEQSLLKGDHYKDYYAADVGGYKGDLCSTEKYIYNAKTQKLKRISKEAWDIAIGGKYVYYLENNTKDSYRLMRSNVNGKKKKKLKTIKNKGNIYSGVTFYEVTSKYCIYTNWEGDGIVYYKYTFSNGKTEKVQVE